MEEPTHGVSVRDPELWGWILFVLCAITFTAAGLRDADALMTGGSLLFLVACGLFLLPYFKR